MPIVVIGLSHRTAGTVCSESPSGHELIPPQVLDQVWWEGAIGNRNALVMLGPGPEDLLELHGRIGELRLQE